MIHQYLVKNISANVSQKENDVSIDLNKKINDQLTEIRKSCHQEYISSNCNAAIDVSNKDFQIDTYGADKEVTLTGLEPTISSKVISSKAKIKAWSRNTCLVTDDSMLSYADETRMSRKFNVKVRSFPSAKANDMFYYIMPLLEKNPDYVILHVGTNHAVDHQSSYIISKIFKLKEFIQLKIPSCKVIISALIKRHDNKRASSVVGDVIQQLEQLNTETIINGNIEKNMLGKKGLHLNRNGLKQFAKNLIDAIREL